MLLLPLRSVHGAPIEKGAERLGFSGRMASWEMVGARSANGKKAGARSADGKKARSAERFGSAERGALTEKGRSAERQR